MNRIRIAPKLQTTPEDSEPTFAGFVLTALIVGMLFFVVVVALANCGINWAALD